MARFVSGSLIALGAVMALGAVAATWAGDVPEPASRQDLISAPAGAQGMVIYRDPATGLLGVPPAGVIPAPVPRLSPRGVVERSGTTPAGGVLLDAVPWNAMTVTTNDGGGVSTRCDRRPADAE